MIAETGADSRGELLLAHARDSLVEAFGGERRRVAEEPWLREQGASFVTLNEGGELRGCIGTLVARRPLVEDVRGNARAAAFDDPRFAPLAATELPRVKIEVSVLSALELIPVASEDELLTELVPGRDGLFLTSGFYRATFLPQVWEALPDPRDFLRRLKMKAGLSPGYWSSDLRFSRYTVSSFEES